MKSKKLWVLNNDFSFLLRVSRVCCLAPIRYIVNHNTRYIYVSRLLQIISVFVAGVPQLLGIHYIYLIIARNKKEDFKNTTIISLNISLVVVFISYAVFHNETRIKAYMKCHSKINKVKRNLHIYVTNTSKYRVIMLMLTFLAGNYLLTIFDDLVKFKAVGYHTCMLLIQVTITNILQFQFLYTALSINFALIIIKTGLQKELSKMIDDGQQNQYCYYTRSSRNIQLESINQAIDTIGMVNQILPNINNTKRQKLVQRISLINDSFVMTCDTLRELHNSDNILLFLQLVSFTFSIVSHWHKIVLLNEDDYMLFVKLLIQFAWCFIQSIKIMMIIEPFHLAQQQVWSRFQATQKDGSVIKLRIQELPWEQYKDFILDYYMKYYVKEEAFHKTAGIYDNEDARREYQGAVYAYFNARQPHVSICCLDDDSNTNNILGMSIIRALNSQFDDYDLNEVRPKTMELLKFFSILYLIKDIKAHRGYETYYEGRGICVPSDYRGMGIANEFIRLRKQVCIENNIEMSCAWMTTVSSQRAAEKYKWKTFIEIPVEEIERGTGMTFEVDTPTFKLMYITRE